MKTETITAAALDQTYVGLKAIITTETGQEISGGISDVHNPRCQHQNHQSMVFVYINGSIIMMGPESLLAVELTPTQLEALTPEDAANSDVERTLQKTTDEENAPKDGPTGHISGIVISGLLAFSIAAMAMFYGLTSPALSGHTIAAGLVLVLACALLLRLVYVSLGVRTWRI